MSKRKRIKKEESQEGTPLAGGSRERPRWQNNRGTYVPPFLEYGKAVAGLGCRLGRS